MSPSAVGPMVKPSSKNVGEMPEENPPKTLPCSSRAKKPSKTTRSRLTACVGDSHSTMIDQPPNAAWHRLGSLLQSPGSRLTSSTP